MDDFFRECQDKLQNTDDPVATINELIGISLQDFPGMQICEFAEQMVTLLSVTFQTMACPTEELLVKYQMIRQQLERTLNYMEQIITDKMNFPSAPQKSDGYWT